MSTITAKDANTELSQLMLALDSTLLKEHTDPFAFDENKLPLNQLIPRIIYERGSFLNLTEEQLQKELINDDSIRTESTEDVSGMGIDGDDNSGAPPTDTLDETTTQTTTNEEFFKTKAEVLNNVSVALNESNLSLDLVSLLISCVRPAAGTISMSAHLKKFIPPGTLNADKIINPSSENERHARLEEDITIGQGWKLSSLENACSALRASSIRLVEEVLKEKVFWDIVMKNFDNKEIIYKTREKITGKRVFGVKYGYEDSGSNFKVRGNAILKQLENKDQVEFIPVNRQNSPITGLRKILRVRILKKGDGEDDFTIVGESSLGNSFPKDDSIKSQIDRARFFIFEEELLTKLIDEANLLIPYNVCVENDSKVTIEVSESETVEIEAVEYNDDLLDEEMLHVQGRTEDKRANILSSYLRLMQTIKFKKSLELKQRPKMLRMSNGPVPHQKPLINPYTSILRPLVGQFRHEQQVEKLYHGLEDLLRGTTASFKLRKHSNLTKSAIRDDPLKRISAVPVSKFVISINNFLTVMIIVDSFDFVNHVYHLTALRKDDTFGNEKQVVNVNFEELLQVTECIEWIIQEHK